MPNDLPTTRRSFASEHGWGLADIEKAVQDLRWLRRDTLALARPAIVAVLERGARSVREWASDQGVPADRALRNLIASAPPGDLDLYRALLAATRVLPAGQEGLQSAMLEDLGPAAGGLLAHARGSGDIPEDAIAGLLGAAPRRRAEWLTRRHAVANPDAPLVERIVATLDASRGQRDRFRLQLLKRSLHLYPAPGALTPEDLERLDIRDVELLVRWPHLTEAILASSRITPAELPALLRAATPAIWARACERAREAVAAGLSDPRPLETLAGAPRVLRVDPATGSAWREALLARPAHAARPPGPLLPGLVARLPEEVRALADFRLSEPAARPSAMERHTSEDLAGFVGELPFDEVVAPLVAGAHDGPAIGRYAARLPAGSPGDEVREALLEAAEAERADADAPAGEGGSHPWARDAAAAWIGASVVRDADRDRALLAAADWPMTPDAVANVAASDPAAVTPAMILDFIASPARPQEVRRDVDWGGRAIYRRLAEGLAAQGWAAEWSGGTFGLAQAYRVMPAEVVEVLWDSAQILDSAVLRGLGTAALRQLAAQARYRRHWLSLPELAAAAGVRVPDELLTVIARDAELPTLLAEQRPPHATPGLLALVGLRSRAAAAVVDAALTPREREEALADVRAAYAGRPATSAAFEVATATSLAWAPYLVALGRQVAVPADAAGRGRQFDHLYRTYPLPKKAGGSRTITAPAAPLKGVQRMILRTALSRVPLHEAATGFRPGLSIKDNASVHAGQPVVVNIDIDSFFPSTGYDQILRACRKIANGALSERAVRLVADICSYEGALPTGAPTSPAIANIVLAHVDRSVAKAAAARSVRYTRYADDLTFSGGGHALKLIPFAGRLLGELGYELDAKKTNVFRRGRRQIVTGLVVNEKADLPRLTRRRLRAALHRRSLGRQATWHERPMDDAAIKGWFAFLGMLRPEEGAAALAVLKAAPALPDGGGDEGARPGEAGQ